MQSWYLALVDCMWGNWTETKCNATCGDAFKTKTRNIVQMAVFGGLPCKGESLVTEKCQLKPCPGIYTIPYLNFRQVEIHYFRF